MNKKIENFFWGMTTICTIGLCIFGIRACHNKNEQEQKEAEEEKERKHVQEQVQIINDPYLYLDRNGVFHSEKGCLVLLLGPYSEDKNSDAVYSVSYRKKAEITDWDLFAANNQLCTECFDSDLLRVLINKSQYQPDSIYVQNSNGNPAEKKYFKYDEYGNIVSEEKWEYKDGSWVGVIKDICKYDYLGNQILSETYFWQDGKWQGSPLFDRAEVKYDKNGNDVERIHYRWNNDEWVIDKKFIKSYDEYNNLIYERYYKYETNKWILKNLKRQTNYYNNNVFINE